MTEMRECEVVALRAEVKRLRGVLTGYQETVKDLMTPQTASNVLENWLASAGGREAEALRVALLELCKKEGWE